MCLNRWRLCNFQHFHIKLPHIFVFYKMFVVKKCMIQSLPSSPCSYSLVAFAVLTQRLVLSEKTEHQTTTASRCLALAPPPRLPLSSGHLRGRWEPWYLSLDLAYFTWHAPKVHPCARARVLFLFGAE